jgi:hypothetical protein
MPLSRRGTLYDRHAGRPMGGLSWQPGVWELFDVDFGRAETEDRQRFQDSREGYRFA